MYGHGMNYPKNFASGYNPFDQLNVTFIEHPYQTFVNPKNGQIDYSHFDQYKNQLVIINFSSEHWNNFDQDVCRQLDNAGINFLLLTYDPAKHQTCPKLFYYPYWYYYSRSFWSDHYPNKILNNKNRNYSLGCLNGNPRIHRIANFLKLKNQPYSNNICISFHRDEFIGSTDLQLTPDEIEHWNRIKFTLPKKSIETRVDKYAALNTPHLSDSYLHLVTETNDRPTIFVSEKTWKPIAAAVPFLIWGNPGSVNFLKSLGVDTYDDVIDHKYYDSETDVRLRLEKLHKIISDLISKGADKVYSQLSERAIINQQKFFQGEFDLDYEQSIINVINR
jgi:hypothetical protein